MQWTNGGSVVVQKWWLCWFKKWSNVDKIFLFRFSLDLSYSFLVSFFASFFICSFICLFDFSLSCFLLTLLPSSSIFTTLPDLFLFSLFFSLFPHQALHSRRPRGPTRHVPVEATATLPHCSQETPAPQPLEEEGT